MAADCRQIVTGDLNLVNFDPDRFRPACVCGVDFSGAAQAGKNAWLAELRPRGGLSEIRNQDQPSWELTELHRLGQLAGSDDRETVCRYLVSRILASESTLWGMDFPFGLPIELGLGDWRDQLQHVAAYSLGARDYGRMLVDIARSLGPTMHLRRVTDVETKTPFDCYHYRIIYQTFHGMRDVLNPIQGDAETAVLPFGSLAGSPRSPSVQTPAPKTARSARRSTRQSVRRVVLEACPSSTLKRWAVPHQRYKQTGGRPPTEAHRQTRRQILRRVTQSVTISRHRRRIIMKNPGGDALDAVIAAIGSWQAWQREDHRAIANHPRYRREGRVYC